LMTAGGALERMLPDTVIFKSNIQMMRMN